MLSENNNQFHDNEKKEHGVQSENKGGPKYFLDIEGVQEPWEKDTITTEEVIALGAWAPSQGAILIDKENNERTLVPGETIEIKPGMGFSKKVHFKRGYNE